MSNLKPTLITKETSIVSKQLLMAAIFLVSALFIETVTFLIMGFNGLPQYLLLDISILLIIIGIVLIVPSFKAQQAIFAIVIIIQILLSYVNVTLYNIFGTVLTVDMINLFREAFAAVEVSIVNLGLIALFFIIAILYITASVLFEKSFSKAKKVKTSSKTKIAIFTVLCFLSLQFIGYYSYSEQIKNFNTVSAYNIVGDDEMLYNTLLFEAESLKKFGTFGFYFQDINSTLFSLEKDKDARIERAQNYLQEGQLSEVGDYTGISENNNLIVIMAESFEWYAVSEELTPTLYDLQQNNVSVTNYHSKSKTNISETFGFLGSYPLVQSFSSVLPGVAKLTDNSFNYSLPSILKDKGYEGANYLINHEKDFYKRSSTHKLFGFSEIYDISDFEVENSTINYWGDWALDSEFFKGAIDTIAPTGLEAPFFNWITTMSMHGPYTGNYRLENYINIIEESNWINMLEGAPEEEYLKNYVAAVMDLDKAIEYLLEELQNRNLLDNTTIVIYGDHEAYYHDLNIKVKGIEKQNYKDPEIYRVPFLIYDANLPTMQIDEFVSPYNIMPTIMDLLGIRYNENMYMGSSFLNSNFTEQLFMSLTGGVFDDDMFTINGLDIISKNDITQEEEQQFLNNLELLIEKVLIFNDLYNYDLFG
jgi:lipoteichoic acid synthase